jgi:hypothetical protein
MYVHARHDLCLFVQKRGPLCVSPTVVFCSELLNALQMGYAASPRFVPVRQRPTGNRLNRHCWLPRPPLLLRTRRKRGLNKSMVLFLLDGKLWRCWFERALEEYFVPERFLAVEAV